MKVGNRVRSEPGELNLNGFPQPDAWAHPNHIVKGRKVIETCITFLWSGLHSMTHARYYHSSELCLLTWKGGRVTINGPCIPLPLWLQEIRKGLPYSNSQYPFKTKMCSVIASSTAGSPSKPLKPSDNPHARMPAPSVKIPPLPSITQCVWVCLWLITTPNDLQKPALHTISLSAWFIRTHPTCDFTLLISLFQV